MQAVESQYCVNCKECVDLQKHYVLRLQYVEDHRVVSLICNQISPEIVTDEDVICGSCYNTAVNTVNKLPVAENPGEMKLCCLCSQSYKGRRNHVILRENPSELEELMMKIVSSETPHQITSSDRLCNPCFKKIKDKATTTLDSQNITETNDTAMEVMVKTEANETVEDPLQICQEDIEIKNEPDTLETKHSKDNKKGSKREILSVDHTKASGCQIDDEIQPKRAKNRRVNHNNATDDQNDVEIVEDTNDDQDDSDFVIEDTNDDQDDSDFEVAKYVNDSIIPRKRAKNRRAKNNNATDDQNDIEIVEDTNDDQDDSDVEVIKDGNDSIELLDDDDKDKDDVQTVETPQAPQPKTAIHLPNYKRAANSRHCFFYGCKSSQNRHTLTDEVRAVMLVKYNYYIPKHARVCFEHLSGDGWDTLNQTQSMNTFNAQQIEHMLSLVE